MKLTGSTLDYTVIYDHYIAARRSAVLTVALKLKLFTILDRNPLSIEEIAQRLALSARGCTGIIRSLVAMELLRETDGLISNTPHSTAFLVSDKDGYLGSLMEMEWDNFLTPKMLLEAAEQNRPTVYGTDDVWENHSVDLENARTFTAAMHSISTLPALALAKLGLWTEKQKVLDMGCGSAVYSIALLQKHPNLTAICADLPAMSPIVNSYLQQYAVEERAQFRGLDMFRDSWPTVSVIILSQILHDWNHSQCRLLLSQAFAALEEGGTLVIHEKLTSDKDHLPLSNTLVNLDMLIWTEGQQFSPSELQQLLKDTGFKKIAIENTAPYWSAIIAHK